MDFFIFALAVRTGTMDSTRTNPTESPLLLLDCSACCWTDDDMTLGLDKVRRRAFPQLDGPAGWSGMMSDKNAVRLRTSSTGMCH